MALTATLGSEEDSIILSYDGAGAFNSIYITPQVPASASGNRAISDLLRINRVRTGTPKLLFALIR